MLNKIKLFIKKWLGIEDRIVLSTDYLSAATRKMEDHDVRIKELEAFKKVVQNHMDHVALQLYLGVKEEELKQKGLTESGVKKVVMTGTQGQEATTKKRRISPKMSEAMKKRWARLRANPEELAQYKAAMAAGHGK